MGDVVLDCRMQRLFLSLLDEDLTIRAIPGGDLMAPPELARNAPGLDVLHPLEIGLFPVLRTNFVRPSRTEAIAGSASVLASANHWSVSIGSMTTPERSPKGCMIFLVST